MKTNQKIATSLILSVILISTLKGFTQPEISKLSYDEIQHNGVTLHWITSLPSDSRVFWMISDSNNQPVLYRDSLKNTTLTTSHSVVISGLETATMYQYLVISEGSGGRDSARGYFITRSSSSGKVSLWFNHTVDTAVSSGIKANGLTNFEKLIKSQIEKATHSIDITLWEFSQLDSVAVYLVQAKNRGVKIRFVYNSLPDSPQIDTLKAHGIRIVKRNFDTTFSMHNKFWIFDHRYNSNASSQYLWTGSTNVTHTQFHTDRNNIIIIQDQSLCEVYTREFEEMWGSHTDEPDTSRSRFGIEKKDNVAHILNVGGTRMEVYFAPTDSIADILVSLFTTKPVKSICFSMLKFVFPSIEAALHAGYQRGIQVVGVFDSSYSIHKGSAFPRMKGENVAGAWQPPADVFIDTLPGLFHHKYSLINPDTIAGEKIVTTGSFNWELPAQQNNDENMLVIWDTTLTNLYFQEFMARYKESGGNLLGSGTGGVVPGNTSSCTVRNYPNPFTGRTTIEFVLDRPQQVHIDIYDEKGQLVRHLSEGLFTGGNHHIDFDAVDLPAGILLCKVQCGLSIHWLKLVYLKP